MVMIHIYNIVKFLVMFIFQLLITVVGIFVVPIAMLWQEEFDCEHEASRPNRRFKWKWFDAIFGNREDGNDGDAPYKAKYNSKLNWWTTYNWVVFRNPIHNLALWMGVNDYITKYEWKGRIDTEDRIGREGFVYSIATDSNGKKYPMYRWCKVWLPGGRGIELNIGYKNFNVQVNELPKVYKYSFTVSFNPLKKFEPRR